MNELQNRDVFLRPRFKIILEESQQQVLEKFKSNLTEGNCKYCSKIVDGHVVIDVPVSESHFWSPQLSVEVEPFANGKALVRGLFGPKPQVWTLFMFVHFATAVAFIGFAIVTYVKWLLKTDYILPLWVLVGLPIFWFVLYFLGRIGKKTGRKQMNELHAFMVQTLQK